MRLIRSAFCCLLAAVPWPAGAMTLQETEVKCPIGGKTFTTTLPMSGSQFGMNLDRRPVGAMTSPWLLAKCPDNGFVIFKEEFSQDEVLRLTPYVLSSEYQALKESESDYYLVAKLRRHLEDPAWQVASSLLAATWEAEDLPDKSLYPRYATEALAAFESVIAEPASGAGSLDPADLEQITGELERRLGRFDAAKKRFTALLADPAVKGTPLEGLVLQEIRLVEAKDTASHLIEEPAEKEK